MNLSILIISSRKTFSGASHIGKWAFASIDKQVASTSHCYHVW
jgi:hypothetical protein